MTQASEWALSQQQNVQFYSHLEDWWGEALTADLIDRIVSAPGEHLDSFAETLETPGTILPPTPSGQLRPALGAITTHPAAIGEIPLALRLLMFTHEVVIESNDFAPFSFVDWTAATPDDRETLRGALTQLQQIRPLIIDGSIKTTPISSRGRHPSSAEMGTQYFSHPAMQGLITELRRELLEAGYQDNDFTVRGFLNAIFTRIHGSLHLSLNGTAHLLALTLEEENAIKALVQLPVADKRRSIAATLARLKVPVLQTEDINTLVSVRQNESLFADWREQLSTALSYVDGLREDESSIDEASRIVSAELQAQMAHLRAATEKSPAIESLKGGVMGLSITGMSALTTGIITGNPFVALAAGAVGKATETAISYVKKAAERKKGKLIIDLSMTFDVGDV